MLADSNNTVCRFLVSFQLHTAIFIYLYIHTHIYMYIYVYTHTHIYAHTYMCKDLRPRRGVISVRDVQSRCGRRLSPQVGGSHAGSRSLKVVNTPRRKVRRMLGLVKSGCWHCRERQQFFYQTWLRETVWLCIRAAGRWTFCGPSRVPGFSC
uniref:Uncharacterized protein n=1 Tax=Anguilla anguilla TaxID=7936 RepID=A0A0E9XU19_ANGAN